MFTCVQAYELLEQSRCWMASGADVMNALDEQLGTVKAEVCDIGLKFRAFVNQILPIRTVFVCFKLETWQSDSKLKSSFAVLETLNVARDKVF